MLIKPCIPFVAKEALSPQAAQKLERIPPSYDTVQQVLKIWQWMLRREFKTKRCRGIL